MKVIRPQKIKPPLLLQKGLLNIYIVARELTLEPPPQLCPRRTLAVHEDTYTEDS